MKREVVWTLAAERDAQELFVRLEDISEDSGIRLVETMTCLVELLNAFPFMTAMWRKPVRRALIRRTHLGLFYVIEPRRLVVIALQDLRRDPQSLKEEINKRLP